MKTRFFQKIFWAALIFAACAPSQTLRLRDVPTRMFRGIVFEPAVLELIDSVQAVSPVEVGFCLSGGVDEESGALYVSGAERARTERADSASIRYSCPVSAIGRVHTHPSGRACTHSDLDVQEFYLAPTISVSLVACGGGLFHGLGKGFEALINIAGNPPQNQR